MSHTDLFPRMAKKGSVKSFQENAFSLFRPDLKTLSEYTNAYLRIERPGKQRLDSLQPGIVRLLERYRPILADDDTFPNPEDPAAITAALLENTLDCHPWLWLITDEADGVYAIAALSEMIPGRHAFLHGVSDPTLRRHPLLTELANIVLDAGFNEARLMKIKAEFEADNRGAKGFCLRMGFTREALFHNDIRIGGRLRDVAVYSRFSPQNGKQKSPP